MGTISYTIPTAGATLNSVADPQISTALSTLLTLVNGNIDTNNVSPTANIASGQLAAALAQSATVNQGGQAVKGAVNIAASESRSNVAYGTLTTPDQVTGIVLPANGLLAVWYQALWQESVIGASRAAIFLGANQMQAQLNPLGAGDVGPAPQAAYVGSPASSATNTPLFTFPLGLASLTNGGSSAASDVTTGQAVGGFGALTALTEGAHVRTINQVGNFAPGGLCYIFAAAGTYTVSVQFKATSGSVTASNRKLWVQAISFS